MKFSSTFSLTLHSKKLAKGKEYKGIEIHSKKRIKIMNLKMRKDAKLEYKR